MKKRERLIREHLEDMKEAKKKLPKKYHPIEGVTEIHYGFAGRKTITPKEIKEFKKVMNN